MNIDDIAEQADHDQTAAALDEATAGMLGVIRFKRELITDETLLTDDVIEYLLQSFEDFPPDTAFLVSVTALSRALVLLSRTDMFQD